MSTTQLPLTIIVAATAKRGIGRNNALPWPQLKLEMAYFARVTKRVPMPTNTGSVQSDALKLAILDGTRRNVVIMGRKTWDSIPARFRPLKDRTNIVISSRDRSELKTIPEDVVVASDILSGLHSLDQLVKDGKALPVGRAFVIGGSSIYQAALELPQTKSVLLTLIEKDYECDTFFPAIDHPQSAWQRQSQRDLQDFVGEEVSPEPLSGGEGEHRTSFEFQLFQRP